MTRSVLYIEDNSANLRLVAQLLAMRPHTQLWTAREPALGLALAQAHRPDLVLLDINLPGMSGFEVLERLQADPSTRDIPVVAVSANAMPQDIERAQVAGFADYVTKPIDIHRLLALLNRLLGNAA